MFSFVVVTDTRLTGADVRALRDRCDGAPLWVHVVVRARPGVVPRSRVAQVPGVDVSGAWIRIASGSHDPALAQAARDLDASLDALRGNGCRAAGVVATGDPWPEIEAVERLRHVDAVAVRVRAGTLRRALGRDLATRMRRRYRRVVELPA